MNIIRRHLPLLAISAVAIVLALLVTHLSTRRVPVAQPEPAPTGPERVVPYEEEPVAIEEDAPGELPIAPRHADAGADAERPDMAEAPARALRDMPDADPEPGWEFTEEELAAEVHELVRVSFVFEPAAVGEEFDVEVVMDGPPLQAVVLAMQYDPNVIEPVGGSAESVGQVFREGVEFFLHPGEGRMALFCARRPGKKNILAAANEAVARFRMRAVRAGEARIDVDETGVRFVGGSGAMLDYQIYPGVIRVAE